MRTVRGSKGMRLFLGRMLSSSKYCVLSKCIITCQIQRKPSLCLYVQQFGKKMYIHVVYVCTGALHTKNSSQCCTILPHVSRGAEWRDLGVPPHLYSNKGYIYLKFQ